MVLLPTIVVNGKEYRGRLDSGSILKALCAGFQEGSEPPVCLGGFIEVNECELANNGGCWSGPPGHNFTACVDTYRGHKCECPRGFEGSGYVCKDVDECQATTSDDTEARWALLLLLRPPSSILLSPPRRCCAAAAGMPPPSRLAALILYDSCHR